MTYALFLLYTLLIYFIGTRHAARRVHGADETAARHRGLDPIPAEILGGQIGHEQ